MPSEALFRVWALKDLIILSKVMTFLSVRVQSCSFESESGCRRQRRRSSAGTGEAHSLSPQIKWLTHCRWLSVKLTGSVSVISICFLTTITVTGLIEKLKWMKAWQSRHLLIKTGSKAHAWYVHVYLLDFEWFLWQTRTRRAKLVPAGGKNFYEQHSCDTTIDPLDEERSCPRHTEPGRENQ